MKKEVVTASAPTKVILFGEHFVVYGEPAVVLAIDKRAYVSAQLRRDERIYISSTDLGISGTFKGERFQAERGGGCMIALAEPGKLKRVVRAIERVSGTAFVARKVNQGVRIER